MKPGSRPGAATRHAVTAAARTIALTLAYEGTGFAGWQRQPEARTVQAVLEEVLAAIDERPVTVVGAGRTDAGVHALGQVVSVAVRNRAAARCPRARPQRAGCPTTCGSCGVRGPPGFDARRDARAKVYRYTIALGGDPGPFVRRLVWHVPQRLDVAAMQRAAALLVGEHDFAAFQAAGGDVKTSVAAPPRVRARRRARDAAVPALQVTGTGFLRHMVRNIVGTLVDIGRHRWPPEAMAEILASRPARAPAPPPRPMAWCWCACVY